MRNAGSIRSKNGTYENGVPPALLVVGHGSRDTRGAREFHELLALIRGQNPRLSIEGGFIELSRPPISECVDRLAWGGGRGGAAGPLLLLAARNLPEDSTPTLS